MIEKLAQYPIPLADVFDRLTQAWAAEGYTLQSLQMEKAEMRYGGKIFNQFPVAVVTCCFPSDGGTYVQMLAAADQNAPQSGRARLIGGDEHLVDEKLAEIVNAVLDKVGQRQPVSRTELESAGVVLATPEGVQTPTRRKNHWRMVLLGATLMTVGSLLAYLNLSRSISFGASGLWSFVALGGVLIFSIGLFSLMWRK
jgi:hypothetical protein